MMQGGSTAALALTEEQGACYIHPQYYFFAIADTDDGEGITCPNCEALAQVMCSACCACLHYRMRVCIPMCDIVDCESGE